MMTLYALMGNSLLAIKLINQCQFQKCSCSLGIRSVPFKQSLKTVNDSVGFIYIELFLGIAYSQFISSAGLECANIIVITISKNILNKNLTITHELPLMGSPVHI